VQALWACGQARHVVDAQDASKLYCAADSGFAAAFPGVSTLHIGTALALLQQHLLPAPPFVLTLPLPPHPAAGSATQDASVVRNVCVA